MDHLSYSSPIFTSSMMIAEPDYDRHTKETSSPSPTTVFAAAEMDNVFRLADDDDDTIETIDDREYENRPLLLPSPIRPFPTGGEPSTSLSFENTQEKEGDGDDELPSEGNNNNNNNGMVRPRLVARQRRSPSSAFRPVGGTKRRCDFADDDDERDCTDEYEECDDDFAPFKRRRTCAPMLCHANPIIDGSSSSDDDDDTCDNSDDLPPMVSSSSYSFASPFERVGCGDIGSSVNGSYYISSESTSSFTSLFAGDAVTISEEPYRWKE